MKEQEARNLFMDYLYDEMEPEIRTEFEQYLEKNPEIKTELEELSKTRKLLQSVPAETPSHKLLMMNPEQEKPKYKRFYQSGLFRYGISAAAIFLMTVLLFSVVNFQAVQTDNGFYIAFGEPSAEPAGVLTEGEVLNLIEQIRNENALLMSAMIEQTQAQQSAQLDETLAVLTAYYDERRNRDLLLIAEGLTQLEEDTYYRFLRTDETLGDIIYALSNPQ